MHSYKSLNSFAYRGMWEYIPAESLQIKLIFYHYAAQYNEFGCRIAPTSELPVPYYARLPVPSSCRSYPHFSATNLPE